MPTSSAPRRLDRALDNLPSLAAAVAIGLSALLLPGCCDSWEGEVCGVMDSDAAECPSQDEFAANAGGEVLDGPSERYYVDLRSDADTYGDRGLLCCYKVKYTTCSSPRVY